MVSIIICTFNRSYILEESIQSCITNYKNEFPIELIVVDNNSEDSTKVCIKKYCEKHDWIKYVFEPEVGLSHARNRGYITAQYDWILYLDDDALVHKDFFQRILFLITKTNYKMIGGLYLPWYKYGKPKWFRDRFASNKKKYSILSTLKKNEFASGGIMLLKKELLFQQNGFHPNFGMSGTEIAYGEEDDFQVRLRSSGTEIGYDPSLIIYHLVPKYKMKVSWFLKSSFKKGKTFLQANGYPHNKLTGLISVGIAIPQLVLHLFIFLPKLLNKKYYKENFIIDVLKKPTKWFGVFISTWNQK